MKIINIVLLHTKLRGIGAYPPDYVIIVQFGVFWRTFFEKFQVFLRSDKIRYVYFKHNGL